MTSPILSLKLNRRTFVASVATALATLGNLPSFAAENGVLNVVAEQQPTSLDPIAGNNGGDFRFLNLVYESLVDWDPDTLMPVPRLASDWQLTPEAMVINIRPGVRFHDDTLLDAEAVKFNLSRVMTDEKSNFKNDLSSVDAVEVTGPLQVTLKLNQPDAALPAILSERAGLMVSPAAVARLGAKVGRDPVGTGPFVFDTWKDGEVVTFKRNAKYWQPGIPKIEQLNYKIITDTSAGLRSVFSGENDIVNHVATSQKSVVDKAEGVKSDIRITQRFYPLWINSARKPFDDIRVRKALQIAVNRAAFVKVTMAGLGEQANGLFPKEHWAYDPSLEKYYGYDPDKAKALLADAGLGSGFEMTLVGPNDDRSRQRQEFVAEQLSQIGIKVSIKGQSVNDALKSYFVDKSADALLIVFGGRPDPTTALRDLFGKKTYLNASKMEPDGFSEAIAASVATENIDARRTALSKIQQIVAENALMVPLAFEPQFTVMSKQVDGFRPNLFGRIRFDTISR